MSDMITDTSIEQVVRACWYELHPSRNQDLTDQAYESAICTRAAARKLFEEHFRVPGTPIEYNPYTFCDMLKAKGFKASVGLSTGVPYDGFYNETVTAQRELQFYIRCTGQNTFINLMEPGHWSTVTGKGSMQETVDFLDELCSCIPPIIIQAAAEYGEYRRRLMICKIASSAGMGSPWCRKMCKVYIEDSESYRVKLWFRNRKHLSKIVREEDLADMDGILKELSMKYNQLRKENSGNNGKDSGK